MVTGTYRHLLNKLENELKIKFKAILTVKAALAAVTQDGYALRYVKDQTEQVALAAVTQNGYALRYVLEFSLFASVATKLGIEIDDQAA